MIESEDEGDVELRNSRMLASNAVHTPQEIAFVTKVAKAICTKATIGAIGNILSNRKLVLDYAYVSQIFVLSIRRLTLDSKELRHQA